MKTMSMKTQVLTHPTETTMQTQEVTEQAIRRAAVILTDSSNAEANFFSTSLLRWALFHHLEGPAGRDPIATAGRLIDECLRCYDAGHGRILSGLHPHPVCFGPCMAPLYGCVGTIDGVEIRHLAGGQWSVSGRAFPPDRRAAGRECQKLAALRKLSAELGLVAEAK
jgi:hypothetical protein